MSPTAFQRIFAAYWVMIWSKYHAIGRCPESMA
jgi:hypothetical protein